MDGFGPSERMGEPGRAEFAILIRKKGETQE